MKRKVFSIEDKMFKTEPLFIVGCCRNEAVKYLKKRFNVKMEDEEVSNGGSGATASVWHFKGAPYRVVWFKSFKKSSPEDIGELAHELMHLVIRICEDKGISLKANHPTTGEVLDEPPAYMIDFFISKFLEKI